MIVFYKTSNISVKRINSPKEVIVRRRNHTSKKLTKSNKDFLRSLGFKI